MVRVTFGPLKVPVGLNNDFKEHFIGNIPNIEIKYFKENFIDNPLKENFTDNTF